MTTIVYNPYEGLDWSSLADPNGPGTLPKWTSHHHAGGEDFEYPHEVIDVLVGDSPDVEGVYIDEPYTCFSQAQAGGPSSWPWTDLSSIKDGWEDRDPEQLGVVAAPSYEVHWGVTTHTRILFSTASDSDIRGWDGHGGMPEQLQDPLDQPELGVPDPIVGFAHPTEGRGAPMSGRHYEPYRFNMERLKSENNFCIMELSHKDNTGPINDNVVFWDQLLTDFAPENYLWIIGEGDVNEEEIGNYRGIDCRWTSVLLESNEFDPSAQSSSRQAAYEAFLDGRLLAHDRRGWDPGTESAPQPPMPTDITVSEDSVSVSYDVGGGAETIVKWVSKGEVVGTGESIDLNEDLAPYVRAQLETGDNLDPNTVDGGTVDAMTAMQPIIHE